MTQDLGLDAAGGPEIGAIPLAAVLTQRYHAADKSLEGFFVRKQAKSHGSQERIEGILRPGMRVGVLDDVLTTGGSVIQAITEIEKVGAHVAAVLCIVDRLEGGARPWRSTFIDRFSPFVILALGHDFGVRRPDAAFFLFCGSSKRESGVRPPHSKVETQYIAGTASRPHNNIINNGPPLTVFSPSTTSSWEKSCAS